VAVSYFRRRLNGVASHLASVQYHHCRLTPISLRLDVICVSVSSKNYYCVRSVSWTIPVSPVQMHPAVSKGCVREQYPWHVPLPKVTTSSQVARLSWRRPPQHDCIYLEGVMTCRGRYTARDTYADQTAAHCREIVVLCPISN
jgi:hypothetical protein